MPPILVFLGKQRLGGTALLRIARSVLFDPRDFQLQHANTLVEFELRQARQILRSQLAGRIAGRAGADVFFHDRATFLPASLAVNAR